MGTERRKNIRFLAQDDAIAAIQNRFTKVGEVKDISIGGLSFEHISDKNSKGEHSKVDIFLWKNGFHMSKVPCSVVYDIPVRMPDENYLFIILPTKRCGVQFGTLSQDQTAQLDFFLKTYTKGTAP